MKKFIKLAWRNIWRNWRRTILTSLAVAFGMVSIIFTNSYIEGVSESVYRSLIETELGHVKIVSREFLRLERVMPREQLVYNAQSIENGISSLPGISNITERIKFRLILSSEDENEPALGVGINPEKEKNLFDLRQYLIQGSYFQDSSAEMLIGDGLAKKLEVGLGDELLAVTTDINYSTYALSFTVAGIFKTGFTFMDKNLIYIPIEKAQEMLDCDGAAHEILLLLEDAETATEISSEILTFLKESGLEDTLTAVPWQDNFFLTYLPFATVAVGSILLIIMLIAALVILNTMLMAVVERTHEIGIIKSMGMRNGGIVALILVEATYIGLLGVFIGGLIGSGLSLLAQNTGLNFTRMMEKMEFEIAFFSPIIYPKFSLGILAGAAVFCLATTLFAAIYPARKASRMEPVEALRTSMK
ncbi:MAG: FtsX-like permease family protein [Candidatus Aminicenantes bacterium]|nr:FtsX-like permease family protein [Candidatus Aminicenantes bacterium]